MSKRNCQCEIPGHHKKLVVVTGGPGAGKTAILEAARRALCEHVLILPEAASLIFRGGFWRLPTPEGRRAAQRAIFHVQREMEWLAQQQKQVAVILCDRGTVDGLAYWPDTEESYWQDVQSSREKEFARYSAVIHLQTPVLEMGYNHENPVRIESAEEAASIGEKILKVWDGHPSRRVVPSTMNFLEKMTLALEMIRQEVPHCCHLKS